jgi:catechol 2,3-dioxygenase-like lactoylglutathione lyase family enzyme
MGPHARVSVITLGVADVPRARSFYQALGWPLSA